MSILHLDKQRLDATSLFSLSINKKEGVSMETLVNLWLQEKLAHEI